MKAKYNHVHIICSDLEEMIAFFVENLDAELVARKKFGTADGATLSVAGCNIYLRVAREDEAITEDSLKTRFGYDHIGFEIEDVDKAYNELTEKGFAFTVAPVDFENSRIAFFKGPDNLTIEILSTKN